MGKKKKENWVKSKQNPFLELYDKKGRQILVHTYTKFYFTKHYNEQG